MSDDDVDLELLDLLRQRLGISNTARDEISRDTGVLRDAEYIYNNSIDVSINMESTKAAAGAIYQSMQEREYSTETWGKHELHPNADDGFSEVDLVNFVFTLDLLNFSFWSELSESERFQVEYRGKRWTGYNSLVACLRRALDEGVAITTPRFWRSSQCTDEVIANVFRSATNEQIPLLEGRISILREASNVLRVNFPDPDGESDEDEYDNSDEMNDRGLNGTKPVAQASAEEAQLAETQRRDDNIDLEVSQPQAPSNIEQLQANANGDEAINLDDTTTSGAAVGCHQIDSPLKCAQTDASASLPDTQVTHKSNEMAHSRQLAKVAPDHAVMRLISSADGSAGKLVNTLAAKFPLSFRDEARFDGRRVKLMKRAQIFVADLWAAFNMRGPGDFGDIDHLTMFPDYRVAQMLHGLSVLSYSPPLDHRISNNISIESGHSWEVQIRGCSIWAVELLRREILNLHPEIHVNAVLIDFFLYDLAKEREAKAGTPHHRTRSTWY